MRPTGTRTTLEIHNFSRMQIEQGALPGPSAVLCMADSPEHLATIRDRERVLERRDLIFHDATDDFGLVRSPSDEDARCILEFARRHESAPHLVLQCQVGVGRSLGARAALLKINGGDYRSALHPGTHNRALYRKILAVAGAQPDPEPLVSLVVRVKYGPDRMAAFLLAIRRQRYDNWELVFVSDGPNPQARAVLDWAADERVRLVETEHARGNWGHPYRQHGIDSARGDLVGLSNDDNYYVPGYLEQMVNALEREGADLAMCDMLHSYWGWRPLRAGHDVGSWIARRELVRRTPWEGEDFFSDARYLERLKKNADGRIAIVDRPLFVHN